MKELLLFSHIVAALVVWVMSLHAFWFSYQRISSKQISNLQKRLVSGLVTASLLGLLTAVFLGSNGIIAACAQVGLYMSPVLLTIGRLAYIKKQSIKRTEVINE